MNQPDILFFTNQSKIFHCLGDLSDQPAQVHLLLYRQPYRQTQIYQYVKAFIRENPDLKAFSFVMLSSSISVNRMRYQENFTDFLKFISRVVRLLGQQNIFHQMVSVYQ
jgi:hypothetical protein